jgi:hypothetical protein
VPAKRLPWFKVWTDAIDHEKVASLTDGQFRAWLHALARASVQPIRGRFASVRHAATATGRSVSEVRALVAIGLLEEVEGVLWVHDWADWQDRYPSDFNRPGRHQSGEPAPDRELVLDADWNVDVEDEDSANAPPIAPPTLSAPLYKTLKERSEIAAASAEPISILKEKEKKRESALASRVPPAKRVKKKSVIRDTREADGNEPTSATTGATRQRTPAGQEMRMRALSYQEDALTVDALRGNAPRGTNGSYAPEPPSDTSGVGLLNGHAGTTADRPSAREVKRMEQLKARAVAQAEAYIAHLAAVGGGNQTPAPPGGDPLGVVHKE